MINEVKIVEIGSAYGNLNFEWFYFIVTTGF